MSYYKYVKRDEKSRVDWGAITTNLVDTLREQEADREKQREAIDASSRATGDILSDAPQGANKNAGEWILTASSDASQYLMSQNRLLKSGLLDPRDFTVNRQNVENSFKSLQTMAESAHKESQLTQDRINEGKAMNFEGIVGQRLDDFQNFEKTQVYFNPTNGVASIGIKDKNGKLPNDPSKFSTIEGAIAQMQSRYDKFDYTSPLVKWSESIGSDVRVVREKGVLTVDDPSVQDDVNSSLEDAIAALTVNDLRVLSIAEDLGLVAPDDYNLGAEETTWGKKGDKVGVSTANDGTVIPKANEALIKAVKERLKKEGLALLDFKQTAMPEDRAAQSFYRLKGEGQKQDEDVLNAVGVLYSGTPDEIDGALKSLVAINPNIQSAKRTDAGVDLIVKDGDETKTVNLPFSDGREVDGLPNIMNGRDWTVGAAGLITGKGKSYDRIARDASWNPLRPDFTSNVEKSFSYGTTRKDPLATYKQLSGQITEDIFKLAEEAAAPKLAPILSQLGFSIDEAEPGFNRITVTAPDGTSKKFDVKENAAEAGPQAEALKAFIESKLNLNAMVEIGLTAGGNSGGVVR